MPRPAAIARRACAALIAAAIAAPALAAPPAPSLSRSAPPWIGYALIVILLALVLGVSLMPSKRGHQD